MRIIFAAVVLLLRMASAHALDGLSFEYGRGTRGVDEWRMAAQWRQNPKWLDDTLMHLYWDATYGTWQSNTGTLQDVGLTPTFRYGHEHGGYFDFGIGFHVLSETRISEQIEFSTKFQFGDHFGIGYRFNRYDMSVRLQHLSNAGIKNPNPGINFLQLRFQYWLK
jgi:lipid A 3-O-deacylase